MIAAIARTTPKLNAKPESCAMSSSWRQVDEPDFRESEPERCVSYFTWNNGTGDKKMPARACCATKCFLVDHLIGARRDRWRDRETECSQRCSD